PSERGSSPAGRGESMPGTLLAERHMRITSVGYPPIRRASASAPAPLGAAVRLASPPAPDQHGGVMCRRASDQVPQRGGDGSATCVGLAGREPPGRVRADGAVLPPASVAGPPRRAAPPR